MDSIKHYVTGVNYVTCKNYVIGVLKCSKIQNRVNDFIGRTIPRTIEAMTSLLVSHLWDETGSDVKSLGVKFYT